MKHQGLLLAAMFLTVPPAAAQQGGGEGHFEYVSVPGLSGEITSVGSDTLENLTMLWAERFKSLYPSVDIRVEAVGSATAPPALNDGTAQVAPMSRLMTDGEVAAFEGRHGYKPTPVVVAIDALAVYVHRDNPVPGLTLSDLDAIFSAGRACGAPASIDTWGPLSSGDGWQDSEIILYGRNAMSGTNAYFRQHALCGGTFKSTLIEQPGSASLVRSVAASRHGIGYSGIGYATEAVRTVPLARVPGRPFVEASADNALAGSYPLARLLYVYVNRAPEQPLDPVTAQFITLALSAEGQRLVSRAGFIPLPARVTPRELEKVLPAAAEAEEPASD